MNYKMENELFKKYKKTKKILMISKNINNTYNISVWTDVFQNIVDSELPTLTLSKAQIEKLIENKNNIKWFCPEPQNTITYRNYLKQKHT